MMKRVIAILAAATLLPFTGASAQSFPDPTGIVPDYSMAKIQPLMQEFGYQTFQESANNTPFLRATREGTTLLFEPRACQAQNCSGLLMVALIKDSSTLNTVNTFNDMVPYSKAVYANNSAIVLSRYLVADYGTTRGSFAVNVAVFERSISDWFNLSSQLTIAVSFDPLLSSEETVDSKILNLVAASESQPELLNTSFAIEETLVEKFGLEDALARHLEQ